MSSTTPSPSLSSHFHAVPQHSQQEPQLPGQEQGHFSFFLPANAMLMDLTTIQGLLLYTLYLLHRLRFFRWRRDARKVTHLCERFASGVIRKGASTDMDSQPLSSYELVYNENQPKTTTLLSPGLSASSSSPRSTTNSINDVLQPEILLLVFEHVSTRPRTLMRCMLVCRSWHQLLGPKVWKTPRILWSRHWSRFHPIASTAAGQIDADIDGTNTRQLQTQSQDLSQSELLTAMASGLLHELDQQEMEQWFEWKKRDKARRTKDLRRRRQLARDRESDYSTRTSRTLNNRHESRRHEEDDNSDDSSEDDPLHHEDDTESEHRLESETECDASEDDTPLMKLVAGLDYLHSVMSHDPSQRESRLHLQRKAPAINSSSTSFPFSGTMARIRRQQAAKETRRRLAQMQSFDGLPASLPLQTCGQWIQVVNLQQETPFPQRINSQSLMHHSTLPVQTPNATPWHQQGQPQRARQQLQDHRHMRPGFLASLLNALTGHHQDDDFSTGSPTAIGGRGEPVRLRSRRGHVTDRTLATILEYCPGLCRLTISECHGITDGGLRMIREASCVRRRTLVSLHMAGCSQITDQGLLNLVGESGNHTDHITNSAAEEAIPLPQFESLDLAGCFHISDSGLIPLLQQCGTRLTQLRVSDCDNISSESILILAEHCPRIQWLDLGRSGGEDLLTERCLIELAACCPDLEWLSLARCHPDELLGIEGQEGQEDQEDGEGDEENRLHANIFARDDADTDDKSHKNLQNKNENDGGGAVTIAPISDRAIALLCESCPKLQLLDLSYIPTITNAAIESLSESAISLVCLTIIGCPGITSQSLAYLAKLRNTSGKLGCITMGDAQGISERDIEQIMQGTLSGWQKSIVDETNLGDILGRSWDE